MPQGNQFNNRKVTKSQSDKKDQDIQIDADTPRGVDCA